MGARTFSDLITFTRASTATYFGSNGVLQTAAVNQPRFDHDPVTGEKLGLLVEEQRTNLLVRSDQFNDGAWVKGGVTVTVNATTAPDGTLTADKVVASAVSGSKYMYQNIASSAPNTVSIYAKAAEYPNLQIIDISASAYYANFNLANGTHSGGGGVDFVSASITDVGGGWYRCAIVNNKASNAFSVVGYPDSITPTNAAANYTGDGSSGIYLWGAQGEAGAFPTSYIPTTTAQVTREADVASITGTNFSDWYRQGEGTLYLAYSTFGSGTGWGMSLGGVSDYLSLLKGNSGTANRFSVVTGGVTQGTLDFNGVTKGTTYKLAGAYKANDLAASLDGATPLTDASASIPTVSSANIGSLFSQYINGHIKSIRYYPKRLTNAELQALTA